MNLFEDFKSLYVRDLSRLMDEIEAYSGEEMLWMKKGEINNSAGNLSLHICGNLQHFIGAALLKTSYVRDREFEFNGQVDKAQLLEKVAQTIKVVEQYFSDASEDQLMEIYPIEVFGYPMTIFYFLVHLQGHLNYHLGQVNYHRRLIMA